MLFCVSVEYLMVLAQFLDLLVVQWDLTVLYKMVVLIWLITVLWTFNFLFSCSQPLCFWWRVFYYCFIFFSLMSERLLLIMGTYRISATMQIQSSWLCSSSTPKMKSFSWFAFHLQK